MLAVHGDDLRPVPLGGLHHQLPGADQGFLVGEGHPLARLDGGHGGPQRRHAYHGGDHRLALGQGRRPAQALQAVGHLDIQVLQAAGQIQRRFQFIERHQFGAELPGLALKKVNITAGRQGLHPNAQSGADIQGLPSDGAGGAQQRN